MRYRNVNHKARVRIVQETARCTPEEGACHEAVGVREGVPPVLVDLQLLLHDPLAVGASELAVKRLQFLSLGG